MKGMQLSEDCTVTLSVFRPIVDEITKITQDENNDDFVLKANITESVMHIIEHLVSTVETGSQKDEKRRPLMKKNSLKKIEELPTIRPSSRGKLSSLSKK